VFADQTGLGLSSRAAHILRDFILLVAIAAFLYWLRCMATAIEHPPTPPPNRPPLDFKIIEQRFRQLQLFASCEEVEELLGPSSPVNGDWDFDLHHWMEEAKHSHRDFGIPNDAYWDLWIDPKDGNRGVAILFAGGKVYYYAKKGC
jgi:hypothetical protein